MRKLIVGAAAAVLASGSLAAAQPAPPAASATVARAEIIGPVVQVTDMERSLKFYLDGLGLVVARRVANGNVILNGEGRSPTPFIMLMPRPKAAGTPPLQIGNGLSRIFLLSADVPALHARLAAAGYKPGPISGGSGVFFVDDPDGYHYEITGVQQRPPATGARP